MSVGGNSSGSRLGAAVLRGLYGGVGAVVALAVFLRFLVSLGASRERLRERRGLWKGHAAKTGPWVWIHAASVGEADLALALAEGMAPHLPADLRFVISSTTATGRARVKAQQSASVEPRYFPIDFGRFVKRVVEPNPPLMFVMVETEVWPTTLALMAARKVPAVVINARLSDTSMPRYRRIRSLIEPALGTLARVCARDPESAARWVSLGARESRTEVVGNMKFDLAMLRDDDDIASLFRPVPKSPLVLAASTHDGEEALAVDAFLGLRSRFFHARLLIAPRHPARAAAAVAVARKKGLKVMPLSDAFSVARAVLGASGLEARAAGTIDWPPGVQAVVIDRLGLLRSAYSCSDAAFVGGSVWPGPGGHNLLEPVALGCPPAAGPHLGNVSDQVDALDKADALRLVHNAGELTRFWIEAVENPDEYSERMKLALGEVGRRCGALDRTVAALVPLLATREDRR